MLSAQESCSVTQSLRRADFVEAFVDLISPQLPRLEQCRSVPLPPNDTRRGERVIIMKFTILAHAKYRPSNECLTLTTRKISFAVERCGAAEVSGIERAPPDAMKAACSESLPHPAVPLKSGVQLHRPRHHADTGLFHEPRDAESYCVAVRPADRIVRTSSTRPLLRQNVAPAPFFSNCATRTVRRFLSYRSTAVRAHTELASLVA